MFWILLIILAITLLYWKLSRQYSYWTNKGVKQRNQTYILGDMKDMLLGKESMFQAVSRIYNAFPDERYMGVYQMSLPTLMIRDPDIIKQITVKDFDHFSNHFDLIPEGAEPLLNKNIFNLKDMQWRERRSTLSPSFTSSRMKMIFYLISECADEFMNHFLKDGKSHVVEMKDILSRYANDVIASTAFGIKCNSIEERENQFYKMGFKVTQLGPLANMKFMLYLLVPKFSKFFSIPLFSSEATDYFFNVIKDAIRVRQSQGIVRPDMLNLLLETRKAEKTSDAQVSDVKDAGFSTKEESSVTEETKVPKQPLTDLDIAAQAFGFFFAGFDTIAILMTFSAYELVLNQEVQKKLQREIDETLEECGGKLNYEALMKMKYMDMVVSETLRKWSPLAVTDRVCSKPYTIQPTRYQEKPIHLKPGDLIWIPLWPLQRDEKYFPNPEQFNPERFNDENKDNIKPYTYLPFGGGPRNCLGSRFALMEAKTILFHMLSKFDFVVNEKTDIPIKLKNLASQLVTENGAWIEMKPRNK